MTAENAVAAQCGHNNMDPVLDNNPLAISSSLWKTISSSACGTAEGTCKSGFILAVPNV